MTIYYLVNNFILLMVTLLVWIVAIAVKLALKDADPKSMGGKVRDFVYMNLPLATFMISLNEFLT